LPPDWRTSRRTVRTEFSGGRGGCLVDRLRGRFAGAGWTFCLLSEPAEDHELTWRVRSRTRSRTTCASTRRSAATAPARRLRHAPDPSAWRSGPRSGHRHAVGAGRGNRRDVPWPSTPGARIPRSGSSWRIRTWTPSVTCVPGPWRSLDGFGGRPLRSRMATAVVDGTHAAPQRHPRTRVGPRRWGDGAPRLPVPAERGRVGRHVRPSCRGRRSRHPHRLWSAWKRIIADANVWTSRFSGPWSVSTSPRGVSPAGHLQRVRVHARGFGGRTPTSPSAALEGQRALLTTLARRMAPREWIWDLINEPPSPRPENLWSFAAGALEATSATPPGVVGSRVTDDRRHGRTSCASMAARASAIHRLPTMRISRRVRVRTAERPYPGWTTRAFAQDASRGGRFAIARALARRVLRLRDQLAGRGGCWPAPSPFVHTPEVDFTVDAHV